MRNYILVLLVLFGPNLSVAESSSIDTCGVDKEKFGQALGMMIYDGLLKEYDKEYGIDLNEIISGIKYAEGLEKHLLVRGSGSDPVAKHTTVKFGHFENEISIKKATKIVKIWHSQSENLEDRFLANYIKQPGVEGSDSGLMYKIHEVDESNNTKKCLQENVLESKNKEYKICYYQAKIEEAHACDDGGDKVGFKTKYNLNNFLENMRMGYFDSQDVIDGWKESIEISKELNSNKKNTSSSSNDSPLEVMEIVIPPDLAYGKKGIPGIVEPNEVLWFFLIVRDSNN